MKTQHAWVLFAPPSPHTIKKYARCVTVYENTTHEVYEEQWRSHLHRIVWPDTKVAVCIRMNPKVAMGDR